MPNNTNLLPESRFIRSELIIRDLALPDEVKLARKSLIRWLALSLGLLLPNESRRLFLDVLDVLVYYHVKNEAPTTKDIIAKLEEFTNKPPYPKAVYYHLLRLKDLGLLSRKKGRYSFGDGSGKKLNEIIKEFYSSKLSNTLVNIEEAIVKLEESYKL